MKKLSHVDKGKIKMVDVSMKTASSRRATASCIVRLSAETIEILKTQRNPKGDLLEIARIAGIMAAKRTSELIPLCHQIELSKINVEAEIVSSGVSITSEVITTAKTGVEMEALTAVSVAALTVYDMCKAVQKDIEISEIHLDTKTGGKKAYKRN
jgi:cyclic pyranopterin monophosphate synthase